MQDLGMNIKTTVPQGGILKKGQIR